MTADLERPVDRRRFDRRKGDDRRASGLHRRRSSDSDELVTITDEEVVRLRLEPDTPWPRIAAREPPRQLDEFDDREPTLTVRIFAKLADGWTRLWRRTG